MRILLESDANTAGGSSSPAATGAQDLGAENKAFSANATETNADDKAPDSLLDLVKRTAEKGDSSTSEDGAVDEKDKADKSVPTIGTDEADKSKKDITDDKEPVDDKKGETDKGVDESLTDATKPPPFHEHPRWKEVTAEREQLKQEVEQYRPIVEAHNQVATFMQENQLTPDDYQEALMMAALCKNNPEEARKRLEPIWKGLNVASGDMLPSDLQAKVDGLDDRVTKGEIDEADAKLIREQTREIARMRAQEKLGTIRTQNQTRNSEKQKVEAVNNSVTSWDTAQRKTDPEFKPKTDKDAPDGRWEMVQAKLGALWGMSPPKNQSEAVALCEKAKSQVLAYEARFKPVLPKTRKPIAQNGSTNGHVSEAKTLEEVVMQTAAKHR